jgi:hypothetical protein
VLDEPLAAVVITLPDRRELQRTRGVERSMSCTPSRFSSWRTIWLAADCVRSFAAAACEKLRQRAMSQNTFRDSSCMLA